MSDKQILINTIPSPTWSWLKMNGSAVPAALLEQTKETVLTAKDGLPSAIKKIPFAELSDSAKNTVQQDCVLATGTEFSEFVAQCTQNPDCFLVHGVADRPVVLSFGSQDASCINRTVIHAQAGSKSTFIFLYNGDAKEFASCNVQVVAEQNAQIHIIKVQLAAKNAFVIDDTSFFCKESASAKHSLVVLGGASTYSALYANLSEYKAQFSSDTGYYCGGKQNFDMNHVVLHYGKKTECSMRVNGTLSDSAVKTYRGTIDFKNGCSGSTGDEQEDTLLLSPAVTNNSIPVILCDEEDVAGEHGASIGRISDEILFYMQSRGLSRRAAEQNLARAKVQRVVSLIPEESVVSAIDTFMDEVFADE